MLGVYYVGHTTGRRQVATRVPEATVAPAAPASAAPPPATAFVPPPAPTTLPSLPTTMAPTPRPEVAPTLPPSPVAPVPTFAPTAVPPTLSTTLAPGGFVEDRPPDAAALAAALGSVERGRFEDARRGLDALLARKDPLQLPVARAKRGGIERCTLTIQPAKRVLRQGGGMSLYASSVKLVDQDGRSKASAMARTLGIEDSGRAPAGPGERDAGPAAYLRLRFGDDEHTIYYWPSAATCRQARRADSSEGMLQCDARGLAQQEFLAGYVADAVRAIAR
jgi:hypothetical protein